MSNDTNGETDEFAELILRHRCVVHNFKLW